MKTSSVVALVPVVALVSVFVSYVAVSPGIGKLKTKESLTVEFEVADSKLEVTAPACVGSKKGCIKIKKKNSGEIKFVFTDPSNTWQLSEFEICKGEVTTDADKANLDCKLGIWERLEFFVVEELTASLILTTSDSGIIDLSQLPPGTNQFYLLNQNDIKEDYFYTITACNAADDCISTDPPIENGGRGWN